MLNKDGNLRDQQLNKKKKLVCKFRQEDGNLSTPYKSNPKGRRSLRWPDQGGWPRTRPTICFCASTIVEGGFFYFLFFLMDGF
jgi:hypothetical protein